MKLFLISIAGLAAAFSAYASDPDCTADALVPAQPVTGNCVAGRCSGTITALDLSTAGRCISGQTFSAAAKSAGGSLVGKCNDGEFVGVATGFNLKFAGACSAGGAFSGGSYVRFQYATGTCDENGAFNGLIKSITIPVAGSCL